MAVTHSKIHLVREDIDVSVAGSDLPDTRHLRLVSGHTQVTITDSPKAIRNLLRAAMAELDGATISDGPMSDDPVFDIS